METAPRFASDSSEKPAEIEVANDTHVEKEGGIVEVMQNVLSSDAWSLFEGLSSAPTNEGFRAGVDALNAMGEHQLNRENANVARDIGNETLASRQIEGTVTLPQGRRLKVSRAMNGLFTFEAV